MNNTILVMETGSIAILMHGIVLIILNGIAQHLSQPILHTGLIFSFSIPFTYVIAKLIRALRD